LLTVAALGGACFAQDKPNFSGTWKLNVERSDFGPGHSRFAQTDVIEQSGQTIKISIAFDANEETRQYTVTLVTDGKEISAPADAREPGATLQTVSSSWEGAVLVVHQKVTYENEIVTGSSHYTLSPNGDVLTVMQDFVTQKGETSRTLVFDKGDSATTSEPTVGGNVALTAPAVERPRTDESSKSPAFSGSVKSIGYAIRATLDIRDIMIDPTSFTLLQVVAITRREKDGSTSFRGCVHYVGSNRMGGREQAWGGYSIDRKHPLEVKSWPGGEYSDCYIHKNEVQIDVTGEVQKYLSEH
jgi:hypothetical protein